jgi:hypothetical protein
MTTLPGSVDATTGVQTDAEICARGNCARLSLTPRQEISTKGFGMFLQFTYGSASGNSVPARSSLI